MPHYRKISVNNKEYEWVVGGADIKIKGIGVWKKEDIGEPAYGEDGYLIDYAIYPSHIRQLIEIYDR